MRPFARPLTICALLAVLVTPALAFRPVEHEGFAEDFDRLALPEAAALAAQRAEVAARFAARFGDDVRMYWGDRSDRPVFVHRRGTAIATAPGASDAVGAARAFLAAGREVFGLSEAEIDALDAAKVYSTEGLGVTHVHFLQRIDGISVFRGQVRLNLDSRGGVLNVCGEYFPGLHVPDPATISAEDALRIAAQGLGLTGEIPEVVERDAGGERRTVFAASDEYLERPVVRLVLAPEGDGDARLVWEATVHEAVSGWDNLYRVLVDAKTGEAVLRELLTLYAGPASPADATGNVFDCEDPGACGRSIVSFAGDPNASPLFWVGDNQSLSQGNNVAVRADFAGTDPTSEDAMADGGRRYEFDFPFTNSWETSGDYGSDSDAGIANTFYWGNVIHDHWYALGFDEAAGNYQTDNFGRGGLGNDRVNADVQDNATRSFIRNNANWSPTNDGAEPRTNYYLWTEPERDGAFDAGVIWHEFGHGLSTRLVGGASTQCLNGAQGGGMGEGWSDWVAINRFSGPTDDPDGPIVVGEYVTGNSERGIRRYPYHVDLAINPLTYERLCDDGTCAVHAEGEIWSVTLWDMRHDLIGQYGYGDGILFAEQLVIDAMKLSPCSPNMIIMRDAILQADEQRYGGANTCLIRAAFARRGMGAGAWSNGTGPDAGADFDPIKPMASSLVFSSDPSTFTWSEEAGATSYRVARGTFGSDAAANTFDDATCQGSVATTTYTDATLPAVGEGFYYVVAHSDACFDAPYGSRSNGEVRPVIDCP